MASRQSQGGATRHDPFHYRRGIHGAAERGYLKIRAIASGPHTVELSASAFRLGVDAVVLDAEAARRQVITILVNDPPVSDRPVHELARLTNKPVLFIKQFLRQLDTQGDIQLSLYLGGSSRITVSPTLKRLL